MYNYGAVLYQPWYLTGQDVPSEDGSECTCKGGRVICQPVEEIPEMDAQVLATKVLRFHGNGYILNACIFAVTDYMLYLLKLQD